MSYITAKTPLQPTTTYLCDAENNVPLWGSVIVHSWLSSGNKGQFNIPFSQLSIQIDATKRNIKMAMSASDRAKAIHKHKVDVVG